jgi:hypothetical protein
MHAKRIAYEFHLRPVALSLTCPKLVLLFFAVFFAASLALAHSSSDRLNLFPRLTAGQTLTYQISYRNEKQAKTKSSVVMASDPADIAVDVRGLLRLEVLGIEMQGSRSVIHGRSWFQSLDSATQGKLPGNVSTPANQVQRQDPKGIAIEFTIFPDGRVDQVKGLDALSPEQQQAWQQWVSRFATSAAFPQDGIKRSQKWKSEEFERSPSPIAKLTWIRESAYLRNEPCRASQMTVQGDVVDSGQPPETCAVIQTSATLKQRSSTDDATPDDYKLHQLHTSGKAAGRNTTLLYISIQTGLLVRSSEQADQTMNVTIAKADGSNEVHYDIHAKSNTEIFRIANTSFANP